jgi:hypothetical protein
MSVCLLKILFFKRKLNRTKGIFFFISFSVFIIRAAFMVEASERIINIEKNLLPCSCFSSSDERRKRRKQNEIFLMMKIPSVLTLRTQMLMVMKKIFILFILQTKNLVFPRHCMQKIQSFNLL